MTGAAGPREVGIGIIGAGRIARVHAEAYRAVAGGRLVAAAESDPGRREAFCRAHGLEAYADYRDLLRSDAVDAVVIAAPNWLHTEMALAAAAAGKHVFCQKPLALTVEETDRITDAARAAGVLLQVGFMLRFTPPMQELKALVGAGGLGDLIAFRAAVFGWEPNADWFYDTAKGGGVILDTMIHFTDLLVWLIGPVLRVFASGGAFVLDGAKRHGSPDNASVHFTHAGGVSSQVYVSWTSGYGDFLFEIYGSKGSVSVNFLERQTTSVFFKGTPHVDFHGHGGGWNRLNQQWPLGYAGEAQYFVDRVRGASRGGSAGRAAGVGATGADARAALLAARAAQEALDSGRIVDLGGAS